MTKNSCLVCFNGGEVDPKESNILLENFKLCNKHKEELMNTDFPKSINKFIKSEIFQDQEIPLTYLGWEKKANTDVQTQKGLITWKQRIKYCLRYSYPEWALDEAGEKKVDKEGNPFRNKNWDEKFPQGYSILYHFEEGQLESGSLPLFEAFCMVRPKKGEVVIINRTGKEKDTKWKVGKSSTRALTTDMPEIQLDETEEENSPF